MAALARHRGVTPPSGRQLYCWRVSREFSPEQAARELQVSVRTWRNWEQEKTKMSTAHFALFAIWQLGLLDKTGARVSTASPRNC